MANSGSSSMVFDFRGKNVTPSVAIHGSLVRTAETEDDNYTGSTELPQPSGVSFEGENEVVNGGVILRNRNKRLKIMFDDSLTCTFEYPSEVSLLEDVDMDTSDGPLTESDGDQSETNNNIKPLGHQLGQTPNNLALRAASNGGLANYKPAAVIDYQLGVSGHHGKVKGSGGNKSIDLAIGKGSVDMVKPATEDETASWSTSSNASDLLF
jgi:hypothetical protein